MMEAGYELKSDLARVCLPDAQEHPERRLAWVNSVCLLFLIIAWSGLASKIPLPKPPPPLELPVPIVIQPLPPPPAQSIPEHKEESAEDKTPSQRVVVVTPDSPAINFSVPTIGNVIAPNAIAQAPPVAPLAASPAPAPVRNDPKPIGSTGEGGDRPQPPYPEMALKFGQQGTVVLLLTVDDSGIVQQASVKETSGSPILDRSALEFVKRHWIVPPGRNGRLFQATISYLIKTD